MVQNIFHQLPQSVLDFFQPKDAEQLTIHAYKQGGEWFFNRFPITFREQLCFPEVLDALADGQDRITLTVSINPSADAQRVSYVMDDPCWTDASIYHWSGHDIWLCPWLQWFFGHKPADLWFTVDK